MGEPQWQALKAISNPHTEAQFELQQAFCARALMGRAGDRKTNEAVQWVRVDKYGKRGTCFGGIDMGETGAVRWNHMPNSTVIVNYLAKLGQLRDFAAIQLCLRGGGHCRRRTYH